MELLIWVLLALGALYFLIRFVFAIALRQERYDEDVDPPNGRP